MCSHRYHSSTWKRLLGQRTYARARARKEKGSPRARPTTPPKVLMLLKWLALGYKAVTVAVLGRSLTCC